MFLIYLDGWKVKVLLRDESPKAWGIKCRSRLIRMQDVVWL